MQETSDEKRFYSDKLKHAIHLLLFKRGKMPGAKEWELKASLGKNYKEVVKQLDTLLSDFDLQVKKVEPERPQNRPLAEGPLEESTDDARYFLTLRGTLTPKEARLSGWRIDNLAALTVAIAYIVTKQGKAPREEIEKLLAEKAGRWKTLTLLDAFTRNGYLKEDEAGSMSLGWRTSSEVSLRDLMTLLAETGR
ncbi:hypothetical protein MUP07_02515 [Candidatus Bathyarchaeota archaeon]|jgi:hypothetical protein|nr:hypothetical protein [Candidatus Bathyarchaeota archaeon]